MKKVFALFLVALALAVGFTACGDDDDGDNGGDGRTPQIRTEKGLAVALAAQAGASAQDRDAGGAAESGQSALPPADDRSGDSIADTDARALQQAPAAGLTVTGYGLAVADADSAIVEFYFSSNYGYDRPVPGSSDSGSSGGGTDEGSQTPTRPSPITQGDLQAVIDAVVAAGASADDIEFVGGSYYDPYYASATLRVTVRDISNVGNVISAATSAAGGLTNIYLQGTYVSYTLGDCAALQAAALKAAVEDAVEQGDALASAVGVTRGEIIAASSYSYSAFGGTSCDVGGISPYPLGGVAYAEGQAQQVQVHATVTVTYAVQ